MLDHVCNFFFFCKGLHSVKFKKKYRFNQRTESTENRALLIFFCFRTYKRVNDVNLHFQYLDIPILLF